MPKNKKIISFTESNLFNELSLLIEESKSQVISYANSALSTLFWQVGNRINDYILKKKRAEYGKEIVSTVSTQLKTKYGKNFEERNLRRMMQFAEQFPDIGIIATLSQQLSWSHFVELLPIKKSEAKMFLFSKLAKASLLLNAKNG
jgi:hypothetical protein